MTDRQRTVLVTGATGYVGGRLVPRLLEEGHRVRVLARTPARALRYDWSDRVEIVTGDVLEPDTLDRAFEGVDVVYYLVHSIGAGSSGTGFADTEARAAEHVRDAADRAGLERIVYLGGMGDSDDLSEHLASRHRVGEILASGDTPPPSSAPRSSSDPDRSRSRCSGTSPRCCR
jgi:uncharacterized protein YbjT (DUF2867 family)